MMSFMTYYSVDQRKEDQMGAKYVRIGRTEHKSMQILSWKT
jgi:hypothetical protein